MVMMIIGLFSGLGLFLYGMKMMGDGLENVAGDNMKKLFEKITSNPLMGVATGAGVTFIIQSSSATTVMVVGFVNAGLMNLYQAASVIMGANIGTTITTQLISFSIGDYIPILIPIGVYMVLFSKNQKYKIIGNIVLGFAILFLGMDLMKEAMSPLAESDMFIKMIDSIDGNIALGILVGALMTAVIQSSSASTGILVALAGTGALPISVAIPILFGNNIGTCVTALISSVGTSKTARKAALIHLSFNIFGTIVFIPLIPVLTSIVSAMDATNVQRQIANAHTIFNIANTVIMVPFIKYIVLLVNKIIPGEDEVDASGTMYIDNRIIETPVIAIGQAEKEINRMMTLAKENLQLSIRALLKNDNNAIKEIYINEKIINLLEQEITKYLVKISNEKISDNEHKNIIDMINMVNDVERVGDHCKNLAELATEKIDKNLKFSHEAQKELDDIYNYTLNALELSRESYLLKDISKAKDVFRSEDRIDYLEEELRKKHIKRLGNGSCDAHSGAIFLDAISNLERIGDHSVNIAQVVLANN
ncbi:Na/Pi cotransporter family protein [Clostridium sp. DL1XJH146]